MPNIQYEEIDIDYWEQLPTPHKAGKPSPWDSLLVQIESGKIIRIPVEGDKERKGSRIGIARRARSRGFKVEFREDKDWLVIRKSEESEKVKRTRTAKVASESTPAMVTGKRRGRPSKQKAEDQEVEGAEE